MKKFLLVVFLIFALFLSGCFWNEKKQKAKDEARQKVNEYSNVFSQQVKEIYGDSAELKNIECGIASGSPGPVPSILYWSHDYLNADLVLNSNLYYAEYDTVNNIIRTDVYSNDIIHEFINLLPIDSAKIVYIVSDNARNSCDNIALDSSIKSLNDVIKNNIHLNIYIITTENLKSIEEKAFLENTIMDELENSEMTFSIQIFSISNTEKLKDLEKRVKHIKIYYNNKNEKKLFDNNSTYCDASYFNITKLIEFRKSFNDFYYDAYQSN